jgi:hypothetical protein
MIAACSLATVVSWAVMLRSLCPLTIRVFTKGRGTVGCGNRRNNLIDKGIYEVKARRKDGSLVLL